MSGRVVSAYTNFNIAIAHFILDQRSFLRENGYGGEVLLLQYIYILLIYILSIYLRSYFDNTVAKLNCENQQNSVSRSTDLFTLMISFVFSYKVLLSFTNFLLFLMEFIIIYVNCPEFLVHPIQIFPGHLARRGGGKLFKYIYLIFCMQMTC